MTRHFTGTFAEVEKELKNRREWARKQLAIIQATNRQARRDAWAKEHYERTSTYIPLEKDLLYFTPCKTITNSYLVKTHHGAVRTEITKPVIY